MRPRFLIFCLTKKLEWKETLDSFRNQFWVFLLVENQSLTCRIREMLSCAHAVRWKRDQSNFILTTISNMHANTYDFGKPYCVKPRSYWILWLHVIVGETTSICPRLPAENFVVWFNYLHHIQQRNPYYRIKALCVEGWSTKSRNFFTW